MTHSLASVGIFWGVTLRNGSVGLAVDQTPVSEGQEYGDFLTHPQGHYEVWEAWRRLGHVGLVHRRLPPAILWHEYEDCPRGRVVYECASQSFFVYADRRLQASTIMAEILEIFGLKDQAFTVRSDAHYR